MRGKRVQPLQSGQADDGYAAIRVAGGNARGGAIEREARSMGSTWHQVRGCTNGCLGTEKIAPQDQEVATAVGDGKMRPARCPSESARCAL